MGRGGGSGGRSSGGRSSGSRSSGGRSGGFSGGRSGGSRGGSSGGSSRGGMSGGFSGNSFGGGPPLGGGFFVRPRRFPGGYNAPPPPPPRPYSRRSSGGFGCSIYVIAAIIIIFAIVFAANMFGSSSSQESGSITKSTVEREALPAGSVNETDYYTDELGWINNETTLLTGMKNFYRETGVQPYLYITDTVNDSHSPSAEELDAFANDLYDQLFTDEAHFLLVFFEYNNRYMDVYVCGAQAKTVIDREAADILLDYIDKYYYYSDLTDEEYFSKAFNDAGERIMTVTRSPWIPVFIVFGVLLFVILLFVWWRSRKAQKNKEAELTKEILNTPLEKFGSSEVEDLAKKYENNPQD